MAGLKAIKTKIRSMEKSRQVTRAMEAVSAVKMRKAQLRALSGRPYAKAAASILARVSGTYALAHHPLVAVRPLTKALYIVITSDKGLAGALNSAVLRGVSADIAGSGLAREDVSVIAVGKKAHDFFAARGVRIEAFHPQTDEITSENIALLVREAGQQFGAGAFDVVKIAYQNFLSTFEQRPVIHTIFPLSLVELQKLVADIVPVRGKFSKRASSGNGVFYNIEPSEEEVLTEILPRLAGIFVYHALLESQASEHSARMVAMKSASDKAGDLKRELTLQFNKARQAVITREVSEITGGMEALADKAI